MESISAVIWTFSVSLIMFCINSKKTIICGTSYEQIIGLLENRKAFQIKRPGEKWSTNFKETCLISPFRILEFFILTAVGGTAAFSSENKNNGILCIIIFQLAILLIFIYVLWNTIKMEGVEKEIQRYIQDNFCIWEKLLKDGVESNWEKLILKDSFEQAAYTAEEWDTLTCWLNTIDEKIQERLHEKNIYEIIIYQKVISSILVNDERFSRRWNFILKDILSSDKKMRIDKMKALTYFLVEHSDEYDEKYLYEFLKKSETVGADMYIWAAAYNYARSRDVNEEWRRIYFRDIYEAVAVKYNFSRNEVEKQLNDEIDEVIKYREIAV